MIGLLLALAACGDRDRVCQIAVTTSIADSGLLEKLLPRFEREEDVIVKVTTVDARNAVALASDRLVDLLIVPVCDDLARLKAGGGITRMAQFLEDEYFIVGPAADPARIKTLDGPAALARLASERHRFISARSDSEARRFEDELWTARGRRSEWSGYRNTDLDTVAALLLADREGAHCLVDSGTWARQASRVNLAALVVGGAAMGREVVCIDVATPLAAKLFDHLTSPKARELIRLFEGPEGARPYRVD